MVFVLDQVVWSDFLGTAQVTFSRYFENGYILLYWPIFPHRNVWLCASHQRAKQYFLIVYFNPTWILGSYLHFWSALTCHQGHKTRVKFILCFMSWGAWKMRNNAHTSGSAHGSGKAEVGDASQFPGWLTKWYIQGCRERCYKFSFR